MTATTMEGAIALHKTDHATKRFKLPGGTRGVSVFVDTASGSYASWIGEVEWSIDGKTFHQFERRALLTGTRSALRGIDCAGAAYVRVRTLSADSSAQAQADVVFMAAQFTREDRFENWRQLAQSRPSGTTAEELWSPDPGIICHGATLVVGNTDTDAANVTVYHDDDGTTYSHATTIVPTIEVAPGEVNVFDMPWFAIDPDGSLAVQTSVASALTFTLYGHEVRA